MLKNLYDAVRGVIDEDWRSILTKAWSVRLIVLGGAISGIDAVFPQIADAMGLSPAVMAALGALISAAAALARVVKQEDVDG